MANNILQYNLSLKKVKFEEINFSDLNTSSIKDVFYDKQTNPKPDILGFRNMLLEVFSTDIGIKVLKINLFLTPNQLEFDGLGFLFLEDKTILPCKLEQSANFKAWSEHITDRTKSDNKVKQDWLLSYSNDECSMKGMSHEWEGKFHTIKDYDVYKETGKFLFDNSPKKFNEKKIAAEKNSYLKSYINTTGADLDSTETINLFNKIISSDGAKNKPVLDNISNYYKEFSSLTGYEVPAELKTIYQLSNGVELPSKEAYHILSIEELIGAWKSWKAIYDDWLLEELKVHQSDAQKTLPMYTTPYWIPFMTDGNGNYIAVDYVPGKKGKTGQIIVFGADEEKITVLAENLNVFLSLFSTKDDSLEQYWGE